MPTVPLPNMLTWAYGIPAALMIGILIGVFAARMVWFDEIKEAKKKLSWRK